MSNSDGGKGSRQRPILDQKEFDKNFSRIFSKSKRKIVKDDKAKGEAK
tara:strand:+ start:3060 stop:3203 length:144 start_codon:yes stop_codon:yes gene_type:complete